MSITCFYKSTNNKSSLQQLPSDTITAFGLRFRLVLASQKRVHFTHFFLGLASPLETGRFWEGKGRCDFQILHLDRASG